jgi:ATP-dependent Lon protease
MQIPVFPIVIDDGVPFPESSGVLDMPVARYNFFKTAQVQDPIMGKNINAVILAFIAEETDIDKIFHHPDLLLQHTNHIGLYCSVEEVAETDEFVSIVVEGIQRVWLNTMSITELNNQVIIMAELEPVHDDMRSELVIVTDGLESIINDCLSYETLFDRQLIAKIKTASFLETKFNVLADSVIKDPITRLKWLMREQLADRIDILARSIRLYKNEKLNQTGEKSPESKAPVYIQTRRPHSFSVDELKRRISHLVLPEETMSSVQRELNRLETLQKSSNDYASTADYLNWIASLPWDQTSHAPIDLPGLLKALDKTHYGLQDVKKDVMEHLALQEHIGRSHGTVLCFVGPAGTGKTSIAKEIAAAMNRPISRIALGGISEESEIRGHRRTYLGSRPGRIIVGMRDSGVKDPLMLLDEIDKMQARHGDPGAALLEALDPAQNKYFVDKYLEVPFDLSQAFFICTANELKDIPGPLRDRMDVIHFRPYEVDERIVILKQYLIPKAIAEYQMSELDLQWDQNWLTSLAKEESQLRQLDMRVRKILRRWLLNHKLGNTNDLLLSDSGRTPPVPDRKVIGYR